MLSSQPSFFPKHCNIWRFLIEFDSLKFMMKQKHDFRKYSTHVDELSTKLNKLSPQCNGVSFNMVRTFYYPGWPINIFQFFLTVKNDTLNIAKSSTVSNVFVYQCILMYFKSSNPKSLREMNSTLPKFRDLMKYWAANQQKWGLLFENKAEQFHQ